MPMSAFLRLTSCTRLSVAVAPKFWLMLKPSGETPMCVHRRAQLVEHLRRDLVGRAVGAVDHDVHALQVEFVGERRFAEFDVAPLRIVDALRPAELRGLMQPIGSSSMRSISASIASGCLNPSRERI